MKKAFTLVEVLIVVAIIGIMAAIVIPTFRGHIQEAKEAAAKDSLRILRNAIELYALQHNNVPPGYKKVNPVGLEPTNMYFTIQIEQYLSKMPTNPFNNLITIQMIGNNNSMPEAATGTYGWICKPATKDIRLDWPGTDSKGVLYYSY